MKKRLDLIIASFLSVLPNLTYGNEFSFYEVKKGDSLYSIVRKINQECGSYYSVRDVIKLNKSKLVVENNKNNGSGNFYLIHPGDKIKFICKKEEIWPKPIPKNVLENLTQWYIDKISIDKMIKQVNHVNEIYKNYGNIIYEAIEFSIEKFGVYVPDKMIRGILAVELGNQGKVATGISKCSKTGHCGFGQLSEKSVRFVCDYAEKRGVELKIYGVRLGKDCDNKNYKEIINNPKKNLFATVSLSALNIIFTRGNIINAIQAHNVGINGVREALEGDLKTRNITDFSENIKVKGGYKDFAREAIGFSLNQYGYISIDRYSFN